MTTEWKQIDATCRRRTVAVGERIHHVLVEFQAGGVGAMHAHPHEQTTYVVSGRCRYTVGDVERELGPGDVVLVPGGATHGMIALETTLLFDTFAPPREDILIADGADPSMRIG